MQQGPALPQILSCTGLPFGPAQRFDPASLRKAAPSFREVGMSDLTKLAGLLLVLVLLAQPVSKLLCIAVILAMVLALVKA
jgi:hypothetical protein